MFSDSILRLERIWPVGILAITIPLLLIIITNHKYKFTFNIIGEHQIRTLKNKVLLLISHSLLLIVSLLFLIASLEISQVKYDTKIESEDIFVLLVVDVSPSMAARDMSNNTRWDAVKNSIKLFLDNTSDKQVGLVVFSDVVSMIAPYTNDFEYLKSLLDSVKLGQYGINTSLSDAIVFSQSIYNSIIAQNKAVVVFTDGNQNSGGNSLKEVSNYLLEQKSHNIALLHINSNKESEFSYYDENTGLRISGTLEPTDNTVIKSFASNSDILYYPITSENNMNVFMTNLMNTYAATTNVALQERKVNITKKIIIVALSILLLYFIFQFSIVRVLC